MNAHFYGCLKISYKISNFVSWLAKLYGKEPNNPISFKDLQQQSIHIVINSIKWLILSYTGWCWYHLKRNLMYAMYIHFEFIIFENKLGNHYGPGLIIQIDFVIKLSSLKIFWFVQFWFLTLWFRWKKKVYWIHHLHSPNVIL
jgi:hypothetical protein